MLYFSKVKLVVIYFVIVFLSLFSLANFVENNDNSLLSKKVNLGLDLQGGSYLLLEVDSLPIDSSQSSRCFSQDVSFQISNLLPCPKITAWRLISA